MALVLGDQTLVPGADQVTGGWVRKWAATLYGWPLPLFRLILQSTSL
ncbi:hypothetical protein A2U01_0008527 [Trifolium medium]|uniref:Uncharacterized protein n=1 Tax=Trifolium medium TaxID=97028 RepID=A0A392MJH6_9FABA|nr:hypothetical protein [Trifolium medium]